MLDMSSLWNGSWLQSLRRLSMVAYGCTRLALVFVRYRLKELLPSWSSKAATTST